MPRKLAGSREGLLRKRQQGKGHKHLLAQHRTYGVYDSSLVLEQATFSQCHPTESDHSRVAELNTEGDERHGKKMPLRSQTIQDGGMNVPNVPGSLCVRIWKALTDYWCITNKRIQNDPVLTRRCERHSQ